MKKIFAVLATTSLLTGCAESEVVNNNIRVEANNFNIRRRVIALNTRTNTPLFVVEGLISLKTDMDGDLNVTIKTDDDDYKLFYAHLSDDVTYTSVQIDGADVSKYQYEISFFPPLEMIEHGLVDLTEAK